MTREEFDNLWILNYPESVTISHLFKHEFKERWFRIHSLPDSKRYAESDKEWRILLERQNKIITDLLGIDSKAILVTGEYKLDENTAFIPEEETVFKKYIFVRLDKIDLYKLNPEDYDKGEIYRPAFAETLWSPNQHDELLREIAKANVLGFFVSFKKNVIIAPYDGGVDFVLKDSLTRDIYKRKYSEWLSQHPEGL